jgi:hypothetical protein
LCGDEVSPRLAQHLSEVKTTTNRAAKHALLLFAIWNGNWYLGHLFGSDPTISARIPVTNFKVFLKAVSDKTTALLQGELICLQDYVEQLRTCYLITCL